jgi:dTDP-glucose 4,6-dehydratase
MGLSLPLESTEERTRPAASEVRALVCDNTKARRVCGWEPRWSLERGLRETIDFIEKHPDLYKPDHYQR